MRRHLMELPRKILVGEGVIDELGEFLHDLGPFTRVLTVSGIHVRDLLGEVVDTTLKKDGSMVNSWIITEFSTMAEVERVEATARELEAEALIGLGGGRAVDLAKLAGHRLNIPFVSVPTSASHDGISSPFASIRGLNRPYSLYTRHPIGILADIDIISRAPRRFLLAGCGDLVAKTTAVKDWKLAHDEKDEYYGLYAAELAGLSANMVMKHADALGREEAGVHREVVEALISAGVAAGIAGSSRPCSGSEHLFSHAMDLIRPGAGLHGEKCGLGTIMMSKLHGLDWERIRTSLAVIGACVSATSLSLSEADVVEALVLSPTIRPERYTILHKNPLSREEAKNLAVSTGVIPG